MTFFGWLTPIFMALRNLRTRPWRTLLTMLGITLGVAVVLAIDITNQSTLDSIEAMFQRAVGQAELLVIPPAGEETLEGELLEWVQAAPGVQVAAPTAWVYTRLANDSGSEQAYWGAQGVQVGRSLEVRGIDPALDPQVRVFALLKGRLPQDQRYEAVVTNKYALDKDLQLGKDLVILTPFGSERLTITGVLADEGAAMANEGAVAFVPLGVLQEIYDLSDALNEIAVQVAPGIGNDPEALDGIKAGLEELLGREAQAIYPAARGQLVPRMLSAYQMGLSFFSIVAIFMGAFLIYNTFSMTVVERTQETGMLRAIGMGRGQILSLVLVEAILLALIGAGLGVLAGVYLARSLTVILGGIITVNQDLLGVSQASLVKSIGTGVAVTLVAALLPAYQAAQVSPLEALRARGRSTQQLPALVWLGGIVLALAGAGSFYLVEWPAGTLIPANIGAFLVLMLGAVLTVPLVVRISGGGVRLLATVVYRNEGALGAGNVNRSVTRTMLTVASLLIALIMIIGVGSLSHTITEDVQAWVDNALGGDLMVTSPDPLRTAFGNQLKGVEGVAAVSPNRYLEVKVAPESITRSDQRDRLVYTAIEPELFRQIADKEFVGGEENRETMWRRLEAGGAIFVSSVVAEIYDLQPGDSLSLNTRHGAQAFTVAGITTEFTRQGYVITGTYADLKRWWGDSGVDQFTIKVAPGYNVTAVGDEISRRFGSRRGISVQTTETYKASVLGLFDQATRLFEVLSLIGVVIGAMGVLNTMTMNVLERTREIGGLRSLGMTRGQVVRMVLAEALGMGVVGGLYGLAGGYVVSHIFLTAVTAISSYEMEYVFAIRPFIISILLAVGVSQAAAIGPARRAAGVNVVAAIKHE